MIITFVSLLALSSMVCGMADERIHDAILNNDQAAVRSRLGAGVNINALDRAGNTPLMLGILTRKREMVRLLLAEPFVDVTKRDFYRRTLFFLAVQSGDIEIVRDLMNSNYREQLLRQINIPDIRGLLPLKIASTAGHLEIVTFILSLPGINPNFNSQRFPDNYGTQPFPRNRRDKIEDSTCSCLLL